MWKFSVAETSRLREDQHHIIDFAELDIEWCMNQTDHKSLKGGIPTCENSHFIPVRGSAKTTPLECHHNNAISDQLRRFFRPLTQGRLLPSTEVCCCLLCFREWLAIGNFRMLCDFLVIR